MELSSHNCVVILRTNRARSALIRRAFLEKAVVELVYKFDEKSYCECESIAKVWFKNCFGPQTYTYIHGHHIDHFTPLALRVRGNKYKYVNKQNNQKTDKTTTNKQTKQNINNKVYVQYWKIWTTSNWRWFVTQPCEQNHVGLENRIPEQIQ